MTRKTVIATLVCLVFGTYSTNLALASKHEDASSTESPYGPKLENLLKTELDLFEGGEVIVSRVTIPPHTSLPKHWHPGEEFAYILEGSCFLWQEGEEEIHIEAGEVLKVPFKKVHTAVTRDDGVTILVFRVHEAGKPERVLVE